ncbi:MAG: multiheme c-type cytochrome [Flavobacteriaceae bacterium]
MYKTLYLLCFSLFMLSCKSDTENQYTPLAERVQSQAHDKGFIGSENCATCHQGPYQDWLGSDHQLAMQLPTEESVLGDFENSTHEIYGVESRFFKKGDKFYIYTQGPQGEFKEFEVKYTFGHDPLQQYLVETSPGNLQVITPFWDSRPLKEGGQRWEHIYPEEFIASHDELHWGRQLQNWNYMCAECHSTNVKKNFDTETGQYNTTYDEINVSCESCHGPGENHAKWAELGGTEVLPNKGLVFDIIDRDEGQFITNPNDGSVKRSSPKLNQMQVEYCARCHARRTQLTDQYTYGKILENSHTVALINVPLYHDDGTTNDEDYVYGSFLQSKMYREGVSCKNCHNVHSNKLLAPGKNVCFQCHTPQIYDQPTHSKHSLSADSPDCISCHMPKQYQMIVDARADHSIRIPRPDVSLKTGSFNACNNCHQDQSIQWAATAFKNWYGDKYDSIGHYGLAMHAGRNNSPGSQGKLNELWANKETPEIVKASSLSLINSQENIQGAKNIIQGLNHSNAIIRRAAVQNLYKLDQKALFSRAKIALKDSVYGVRFAAASILYSWPIANLNPEDKALINQAKKIYFKQLLYYQDRSTGEANIASAYAGLGDFEQAEIHFKKALRMDSLDRYALVNYADLKRQKKEDNKSLILLKKAIEIAPEMVEAYHALGFTYIRLKQNNLAIQTFEKAYEIDVKNANSNYYYALMLSEAGQKKQALELLDQFLVSQPYNMQILNLAFNFSRELSEENYQNKYLDTLIELYPNNPQLKAMK